MEYFEDKLITRGSIGRDFETVLSKYTNLLDRVPRIKENVENSSYFDIAKLEVRRLDQERADLHEMGQDILDKVCTISMT